MLIFDTDWSDQDLERSFARQATEGKRTTRVPKARGGAGGDQGAERRLLRTLGRDNSINVDPEPIFVEGMLLRRMVHVNNSSVAIEEDRGSRAGIEDGLGVQSTLFRVANGTADTQRVL